MREGEMMSKNETDGIRNARERARESAKSKETFVGLTDSRGRSLHRSYVRVRPPRRMRHSSSRVPSTRRRARAPSSAALTTRE